MSWPFDSQDRDAIRVLALSARECIALTLHAYNQAELAYAEGDNVRQAEGDNVRQADQLDRAAYWQLAATGFE